MDLLTKEIIDIINHSKNNAFKKVNEDLMLMYWEIGKVLFSQSKNSNFGDPFIDGVAKDIQNVFTGIKGFIRRGLYRMKQFYETYRDD